MPLRTVAMTLAILGLIACSGEGEQPDNAAAREEPGTIARPAQASSGVAATTIHLVLSGGPHAGSYHVDATQVTCTYGFAGEGSWGNAFSDESAKPSSVQLVVPDAKGAANGTSDFRFTATFGDLLTGTQYDINRLHGREDGEGTATVVDRGSNATVTVRGTTNDGVGIDATLECREVTRA